jgi:hypothetical protein
VILPCIDSLFFSAFFNSDMPSSTTYLLLPMQFWSSLISLISSCSLEFDYYYLRRAISFSRNCLSLRYKSHLEHSKCWTGLKFENCKGLDCYGLLLLLLSHLSSKVWLLVCFSYNSGSRLLEFLCCKLENWWLTLKSALCDFTDTYRISGFATSIKLLSFLLWLFILL